MNTDFYAEQLVTKKPNGGDTAKKILIGIATAFLAAAVFTLFFFFIPFNLIGAGLIFYGGYYFISSVDTEYEYILTNGEIDIDKITGKRKRKRLMTASIDSFTSFGKLSEAPEPPDGITTVLATDGTEEGAYYADLKHQSAGNVRLIFTPGEKMIDGVIMFLPRQLKAEARKNRTRLEKQSAEE
ncbi:MAG: hypothetical protein NC120_00615 [Ruminococcus sp.]|nr:hypothetical protein [Ruminococcus sp.]